MVVHGLGGGVLGGVDGSGENTIPLQGDDKNGRKSSLSSLSGRLIQVRVLSRPSLVAELLKVCLIVFAILVLTKNYKLISLIQIFISVSLRSEI